MTPDQRAAEDAAADRGETLRIAEDLEHIAGWRRERLVDRLTEDLAGAIHTHHTTGGRTTGAHSLALALIDLGWIIIDRPPGDNTNHTVECDDRGADDLGDTAGCAGVAT